MSKESSEIGGRRILITGANGFVGCHTIAHALAGGAEVLGMDLPGSAPLAKRVRTSLGTEHAPHYEVDAVNADSLADALAEFNPDIIIHLAGAINRDTTPQTWTLCAAGNTMLTAAVIAAVAGRPETSRPVVVIPGSQMEYGLAPMPWIEEQKCQPTNPYAVTKLAATELLCTAIRAKVLNGCVTRLPLVYGPAQPPSLLIPELILEASRGVDIPITEGRQRRRFALVSDMARLLLKLGAALASKVDIPPLINAPANPPISIVDVARQVLALMNHPVELLVGALPQRQNEQMEAWPDTTLADSLNLIDITPFEQGLRETIAWYAKNQWFTSAIARPT